MGASHEEQLSLYPTSKLIHSGREEASQCLQNERIGDEEVRPNVKPGWNGATKIEERRFSSPKCVGETSDKDLTPRPLKIVKRRKTSISDLTVVDFLQPLSQSQSERAIIPHRRSSSLTGTATHLTLSQRDPSRQMAPRSRRHNSLNVRKQRPSDTSTSMNSAASRSLDQSATATVSSSPYRRISPGNGVMGRFESSFTPSVDPACATATSTAPNATSGALNHATHRYNHENADTVSSKPLPWAAGGRRMVTANYPVRSQAALQNDLAPRGLRRQPSFKYRLLNRMMSGLTVRMQGDHIDEADEQPVEATPKASMKRQTSRTSTASLGSDENTSPDLDSTLAAFPNPPTSNITSPSTVRSMKSAESRAHAYRELSPPSRGITLGAELRIISYHDYKESDRRTHVAIEICATTDDASAYHEMQSQHNALDVAVIIDNSLHISPASLMASCETTRLLASSLDTTIDRMAILCTLPADEDQKTLIVSPLSRINLRKMKATLDSVASSATPGGSKAMVEAVKYAQRILINSKPEPPINEFVQKTFGHVVVLTADTGGLYGEDLSYETIQTHILCTGIPRQCSWDDVDCNGWKMCVVNAFKTRDQPHHPRSKKNLDPYSLDSKLQALARHARGGILADCLTDLVLDVQPNSGCTITKTLGWSNYSKLRIGEVKTVVIELNLENRPSSLGYLDLSKWSNTSIKSDDLVGELDQMLGLPMEGILTAKLTYRHSSLPSNTTCTTAAKFHLQLPLPARKSQHLARIAVPSKSKMLVQQRLADNYAAYQAPRDALLSLKQHFGLGDRKCACPEYINALADELRYQARISERMAIENSPQKPSQASGKPHPGICVDYFDPSVVHAENYEPRDWISLPDEDILAPGESHVELAEQLGLDNARKIWSDLRSMSKGENNGSRRKASTTIARQERAKKLMEMALNNKRSIGESTIRSFTSPVRGSSRSRLLAPWL